MNLPDDIKKAMVAESVRVENRHSFIEGAEWMAKRCEVLLEALELIAGGSEFQDANGERLCINAAREALAKFREGK